MKILILEDDLKKLDRVVEQIYQANSEAIIEHVENFTDYLRKITTTKFDLLIVDLVVPQYRLAAVQEVTEQIIEVTRGDYKCLNFRTQAVALTGYDASAEEGFKVLNLNDITVINYSPDAEGWVKSIQNKVLSCAPRIHHDFVVICALAKEADAFAAAGYEVGDRKLVGGLSCRELKVGSRSGVIVTAPRMGLVSAAVTSTQAIEFFSPKLVCMSGICAGVEGRAQIYDVIISETCHQNDSGKWAGGLFQPEIYSVPMDHQLCLQIDTLISRPAFLSSVAKDVSLSCHEFPTGVNELKFRVMLAPTSSGSAVIADEAKVDLIEMQQRKLCAFEMEAFAVYEAARLSLSKPKVFSAKSVVDDGSPSKGDAFHRVACILSAKVVWECISSGMLD
jgi:nucleoside phosphorylase